MDFKTRLKNDLLIYIRKNEEYNSALQQLQVLREEKQQQEENIMSFLEESNIDSKIFVVNDYKVTQKSYYQYQQMSLKYIEKCLKEYCEKKNITFNVKECLEYMKESRDKKEKKELKLG